MMPTNKGLFYLYQFAIIFVFLAIALIPAIVIGMGILNSELAYAGIFLTLYFGLFILCFKAFTNKNNANDNTSGVATILTLIEELSREQLEKVAFILFDNEEKGLQGAKAYSKAHKTQMQDKMLVNFDCVANGKNVIFIAKPKAEANPYYTTLKESFKPSEDFNVDFYAIKDAVSNSDYKKFEQGVCCVACKKSRKGILYTPYIHTKKDVIADVENIEFLVKSSVNFVDKI
jgi:Zn-dependent M28 family amino/carboxypeptidase